ncbi:MAG TPA: ribonuclease P protein component [Thermoanaerobaculia bacterium]|nr:ribonuclease P protein component [Thermoanaerobaculia bacterium]
MSPGQAVREAFSRDDRLRKRNEFEECYASGVRVSGRYLLLFLLPGGEADAGRARLGISVGKRSGGSVVRNRLRRRVREIFRRHRPPSLSGVRIVVNVRPSAASTTFSELAHDYLLTLERGVARLRPR